MLRYRIGSDSVRERSVVEYEGRRVPCGRWRMRNNGDIRTGLLSGSSFESIACCLDALRPGVGYSTRAYTFKLADHGNWFILVFLPVQAMRTGDPVQYINGEWRVDKCHGIAHSILKAAYSSSVVDGASLPSVPLMPS